MKKLLLILLLPLLSFGQFNPVFFASGKRPNVNLLSNTEGFDNVYWVKTNTTVTANLTTSPNGALTSDKIIASVSNADHYVQKVSFSMPIGTYTLSCFFKKADYSYSYLGISDRATATVYAILNLDTGAIFAVSSPVSIYTSVSGSVQNVNNGWYRLSLTVTTNAVRDMRADIGVSNNSGNIVFIGDAVQGVYAWGAQLELGALATGYQKR